MAILLGFFFTTWESDIWTSMLGPQGYSGWDETRKAFEHARSAGFELPIRGFDLVARRSVEAEILVVLFALVPLFAALLVVAPRSWCRTRLLASVGAFGCMIELCLTSLAWSRGDEIPFFEQPEPALVAVLTAIVAILSLERERLGALGRVPANFGAYASISLATVAVLFVVLTASGLDGGGFFTRFASGPLYVLEASAFEPSQVAKGASDRATSGRESR